MLILRTDLISTLANESRTWYCLFLIEQYVEYKNSIQCDHIQYCIQGYETPF